MAGGIVPATDVKPILSRPLGLDAIFHKEVYSNPNRFFCHRIFYDYFNYAPLFLQKFVDPIDSIYLSCAIAKILIQIALLILLAMSVSGVKNVLKADFILAAALITPFFQTNGYRDYMGIIDPCTTYTFFYALPCVFLLLYFTPFIQKHYHHIEFDNQALWAALGFPLAFVVCLSGPLNPGVVLIFAMLTIWVNFKKNYTYSTQIGTTHKCINAIMLIPKNIWYYLVPISILALYSLFLGLYNPISIASQISLGELYLKLPYGIYYQFTQKLGFPILFTILIINIILIRKNRYSKEGEIILNIFKWIGLFSFFYILLLPLGGYRSYRFYILRYDTIMPITLSLIFIFSLSTLFIIKHITNKYKLWYILLIIGVLAAYTNADEAGFNKNDCERLALKEIADSKDKIVHLQHNCAVLSWLKITQPEVSEVNAELLYRWHVTDEKKLYYGQ
jgi:hypothetical protein